MKEAKTRDAHTCFLRTYSSPASAFRRSTFSSCCFASFLYEISSLASLQDDVNSKRGENSSRLEAVTQCCSIKQTDNIGPSMKSRAVMATFHRRGHLSSFCPTSVWLRGHAEIISHRMERHTPQQQAGNTPGLHTAATHCCYTLLLTTKRSAFNYTSYSTYIQRTFWSKDNTQGCTCIFKKRSTCKKIFMEQTFIFTLKYKKSIAALH